MSTQRRTSTHPAINSRTVLAALSSLLLTAPALAQTAHSKDADPLAGPRVVEAVKANPLATVDFNGMIRRPETTPEQAVLAQMTLDEKARDAVTQVFERRQAILDDFVVKEINLLTKFGVASGTNDKLDLAALGIEAFQKLAPLREGGSLWEQVMAALPDPSAADFNTRMSAYWDAIVAEGKKLKKSKDASELKPGKKPVEKERSRFEIVADERLKILGQEIKDTFERQQASGEYLIKYFTHDLNLSPTQKARIQEMTLTFINETSMKPNDEQQKALALQAMSILTEEQRLKMTKKIVDMGK